MNQHADYVKSQVIVITSNKQSLNVRLVKLKGRLDHCQKVNIQLLSTLLAFILPMAFAFAQDNRILSFEEAKEMADEGDAYGEAVVAFHYSVGWQTEKNLELAAKYAMSSARKGHPLGIFRLGALRRAGEGIEKNEEQGLALQAKAIEGLEKLAKGKFNQNNPYALTALGVVLFQGKVVQENLPLAAEFYKKAAKMNFAPAMFNYSMCAEAGHGIMKSEKIRDIYLWKSFLLNYPAALEKIHSNPATVNAHARNLLLKICEPNSANVSDFITQFNNKDKTNHVSNKAISSEIRAVTQDAPLFADKCAINSDASLFAVVNSDNITTYELPSGRLINQFSLPVDDGNKLFICDVFFRKENLIVVGWIDSNGTIIPKTAKLHFLDYTSGRATRPPLELPDAGGSFSYCSGIDTVIYSVAGEGFYSLNLESGIQSRLEIPDEIKHRLKDHDFRQCIFANDGNILLFDKIDRNFDSNYTMSDVYKISINGILLQKFNRTEKDFIENFSNSYGIPKNAFHYDVDKEFGEILLREDYPENYNNFCFRRSAYKWGFWQSGALINLNKPVRIWCFFGKNGDFQTQIDSHQLEKFKYVTSSKNDRKILIWGIQAFPKNNLQDIPYVFDLKKLEISKWSLPKSHTLLNAKFNNDGGFNLILGEYIDGVYQNNGLPTDILPKFLRKFANKSLSSNIDIKSELDYYSPYYLWGSDCDILECTDEFIVGKSRNKAVEDLDNSKEFGEWHSGIEIVNAVLHGEDHARAIDHASPEHPKYIPNVVFLANSGHLVFFGGRRSDSLNFIGLASKTKSKNFNIDPNDYITGVYSLKKYIIIATSKAFHCLDATTLSHVSSVVNNDPGSPILESIALNENEMEIYVVEGSGSIRILGISDNGYFTEKVKISHSSSGFPILFDPSGRYLNLAPDAKGIHFTNGKKTFPLEQFDLRLNRPDIVLERLGAPDEAVAIAKQLREKRLNRMGVTEDMLQPDFHLPEIEIVGDLPSSTAESELALKIRASDSKYPLDCLRLYVNNVPVNGKEGELLRDANSQSLERTIPIKLAAGRNKIQISVLNSAGAESLYANAEVTCTAQRAKPTLYAVAMGVSEYANPEWNLKYAAKDARDILERVNARSGSSYGEIKELLLTDREATKESLGKIREFLSKATVDDTVLMFVAGHGLLDSKYDYYFGTSDIDFNNPSGNGIAFEEFDDLLAELPCLRKSLLIDTCHAGELDEDEKKMLASAQANPNQVVAMLPTGARGMTIKPIEGARGKSEWYDRLQGLFVDLRRGSGSTILSSSAGAEYALESSEQKNGLFTYAVLEALDGKEGSDANKDGSVTMSELADYVKTRVAALTNNKQSPNVRRVNLEADFALSSSKSRSQSKSEKIIAFDIALAKADLGEAYAQAVVSIYYGLGLGCEPDPVKSKEYALLSAKQQNPLGIYRLAEMRQTGEGMEQNSEQALQLIKKAKPGLQKLSGDPYAMTALATIYERENPASPKVRELLAKSAEMGYEPAKEKLLSLHETQN